ncbi:MAG: UDP-N-acetylmuramoyl-L-alanine--D-glutamate ligase [Patescibacteria group bacterium]|nr:UDP-N-acetylmuramoyl-L-alanine--D-glutamate ligase [Patescibacteria group bacterium]
MALIDDLKRKYYGKKVLVVGLGLQGGGLGTARFFSELGAKVIVTDKKTEKQLYSSIQKLKNFKNIDFHLGSHSLDDFVNADIIFKGPSVSWQLPEIIEAEKRNIPIEMEMSFTAFYFPGKIIGITGTRGKSTTTNLIFNVLKEAGFKVFLGGGLPGICNIEFLKKADKNTWLVAELSSWALSGFHNKKISPHIAVFTSFYPDHLNYYKNMNDYLFDKKAIYLYQKENDYLVANKSLKELINEKNKNIIWFSKNDFSYKLKYLRGDHNLENAASALKVAQILNINQKKAVKIISNFKGVPYRQEIIKEKNGIIFVNDTTSTTPTATIKAIESFSDKKIILILGGNSKNLPFDDLIKNLNKTEKIVLLAGSFTDEILKIIKKFFSEKITEKIYDNLEEAIKKAYDLAKEIKSKSIDKNEICILFSPGATSFAMFNNEFHRGDEFNKIVKKIIS